jgi:hypothetical protein
MAVVPITVHVYDAVSLANLELVLVEVNAVVHAYAPNPVPDDFVNQYGVTDASGIVDLNLPGPGFYYQLYISKTGYPSIIETIPSDAATIEIGLHIIDYEGISGTGIVKGTVFSLFPSEDTRFLYQFSFAV